MQILNERVVSIIGQVNLDRYMYVQVRIEFIHSVRSSRWGRCSRQIQFVKCGDLRGGSFDAELKKSEEVKDSEAKGDTLSSYVMFL